jgi:ABC-type xylose transport system permease subunit
MQLDLGIIRLDLIFELISGIIALMVTYYATKAYRLTGQKRLSDLSTGFLVLSAGMFGRVIGTWYFLVREPTEIVLGIVTVAYGVSRIMAYIIFVISTRPTHREPQAEETTGVTMLLMATFLVNTSLEVVAILVLVVVVLQAILNYLTTRSKFARYVLLGFLLLLLSHVMMAQVTTAPGLYLLSQGAQLLGFLSFLVMLYQAGRNE